MDDAPFDVAFTTKAGKDFKAINRYLQKKASSVIAEKVLNELFFIIQNLSSQPERYPPEPGLTQYGNFRVILKGNYKIFYEFTGQEVIIYRIVHAKRDLQSLFKKFKP